MYPRYEWRLQSPKPSAEDAASLLSRVLYARGCSGAEQKAFLDRSVSLRERLPDIHTASERFVLAGRRNEVVYIHGDYDVDGLTSTAIIRELLTRLGARAVCRIPDREGEGYGLSPSAVEEARLRNSTLIVAVDCGTSDFEAVSYARALGIDVVILDHHLPHQVMPHANAIVNPQRPDCDLRFRQYAAAGVCYLLAHEILGNEADDLVDLAALGTVADVMPLLHQNREMVFRGLSRLEQRPRLGLKALLEVARVSGPLSARDIAFTLAPRLNAAGRMGCAGRAFDLLVSEDPRGAYEMATSLELENKARQDALQQMVGEALEMMGSAGFPVALFAKQQWRRGVLGLLAGKLCEMLGRPVAAVSIENGIGRGSARSTVDYDIFAALTSCSPLLERFGGHSKAAGFDVRPENLEALREGLADVSRAFLPGAPVLMIDAEALPGEITLQSVSELQRLEPCGEGNPSASFLVRAGGVCDLKRVGGAGQHLKFALADSGLSCIWFNAGTATLPRGPLEIAVLPRINCFGSRTQVELMLRDLRIMRPERINTVPTSVRYAAIKHGDHSQVERHLRRSGSGFLSYPGKDLELPGSAVDLMISAPPENPFALKSLIQGLAPGSRVVLTFQGADIEALVRRASSLSPQRETLLSCYQILCERGNNGFSVEDYAFAIEAKGMVLPPNSGTLSRTALDIFVDLGIAERHGQIVVGKPTGGKTDLGLSRTHIERKAQWGAVVELYTELCFSVEAFLDWLVSGSTV